MSYPLVTLLMTTYQHERFVGEAMEGLLAQDYPGELEILVSDDASTDGTWDEIQRIAEAYGGPHRLITRRNERRLGPLEHNAVVWPMASARLLVRCHGDDVSLPQRVRRVTETWLEYKPVLISSSAILMDEESRDTGYFIKPGGGDRVISPEEIVRRGWQPAMLGASFSWEVSLHKVFGPIRKLELPKGGGDHLLPFRAALLGGFYYLDEPLLRYRQHSGQLTRHIADRTGSEEVFHETLKAFDVTARMAMLRSLLAVERQGALPPELAGLRGLLMGVIVELTSQWVEHRNRLLVQDWLPTWVQGEHYPGDVMKWAFTGKKGES